MVLHRLVMLSTVAQYTRAESSKVSSLVCFSSCVEHVFSSLAEHIQVEWSKVSSLVAFQALSSIFPIISRRLERRTYYLSSSWLIKLPYAKACSLACFDKVSAKVS